MSTDIEGSSTTAEPYSYDAKLVQLLQLKIARQEREMEELRNAATTTTTAANPPAKIAIPVVGAALAGGDSAPETIEKRDVCGIDVAELEAKYDLQYAVRNGVPTGSASLSMVAAKVKAKETPSEVVAAHHPSSLGVTPWPTTENELRNLFSHLDADNRGHLDKALFTTWYTAFENYGAEETPATVRDKLARYHSLGQDKLSYEEFAIIMLQVAVR